LVGHTARVRVHGRACEPNGSSGCAASPRSVTRPNDHFGTGSRSKSAHAVIVCSSRGSNRRREYRNAHVRTLPRTVAGHNSASTCGGSNPSSIGGREPESSQSSQAVSRR
jgi:hypothetical protein